MLKAFAAPDTAEIMQHAMIIKNGSGTFPYDQSSADRIKNIRFHHEILQEEPGSCCSRPLISLIMVN